MLGVDGVWTGEEGDQAEDGQGGALAESKSPTKSLMRSQSVDAVRDGAFEKEAAGSAVPSEEDFSKTVPNSAVSSPVANKIRSNAKTPGSPGSRRLDRFIRLGSRTSGNGQAPEADADAGPDGSSPPCELIRDSPAIVLVTVSVCLSVCVSVCVCVCERERERERERVCVCVTVCLCLCHCLCLCLFSVPVGAILGHWLGLFFVGKRKAPWGCTFHARRRTGRGMRLPLMSDSFCRLGL